MTDPTPDPDDTTASPAESPVTDDADGTTDTADSGGRSIARYAQWAAFGILVLVALVASLQFYFAASAAVNEFVTRRYRPLFRAGFNLVVVLVAATGISLLVRRLA
ncbi:hypothetical protein ACFQL1_19615 [Halomicroarcula sp. GCM10025709]|uniref:hypothetical protein n=1 Tax=Haloarcula TaxID=2237 RepID=UPI0024C23C80|nr:hypothetical protein [Halomicroarcula sp. YJ-61-S]